MQRKQARTGEEREEEEEEQLSESESEDEDNEIIYNPKNLPLGWDGKVRIHFISSPVQHKTFSIGSCIYLLTVVLLPAADSLLAL